MLKIIACLLLTLAAGLPTVTAATNAPAKHKPPKTKLAYPKILNIKNGLLVSPLIVQDCDPGMHDGTIMVFLDNKLIGVGGRKVGGTKYSPITKVTLSKVKMTKGRHVLYVTDGVDRSIIGWVKG